jgi:hypothetical protein
VAFTSLLVLEVIKTAALVALNFTTDSSKIEHTLLIWSVAIDGVYLVLWIALTDKKTFSRYPRRSVYEEFQRLKKIGNVKIDMHKSVDLETIDKAIDELEETQIQKGEPKDSSFYKLN